MGNDALIVIFIHQYAFLFKAAQQGGSQCGGNAGGNGVGVGIEQIAFSIVVDGTKDRGNAQR